MQKKVLISQPHLQIKMRYVAGALILILLVSLAVFFVRKVPGVNQPIPSAIFSNSASPIKTVFVIVMENHNWSEVTGPDSPYMTQTLVPMGAHAEQYYNPPDNHPSLPNYLWLEAGTNFGISEDNDPSVSHQGTTQHLTTLLNQKGVPWKAYEENISGTECPLENDGLYGVRHDPFVYFDDVTGNMDAQSSYCMQHVRPYTELATDLQNNKVSGYNFITPNTCDDTHDCSTAQGDTWLSHEVPTILNSQAYHNGGAIFITWDEANTGDGPIGMVVLSPLAKKNYSNTIHYTHSSTLRTMEEIFGVSPFLGDAANATDLSDFFTVPLTASAHPQQSGENSSASHGSPAQVIPFSRQRWLGDLPRRAERNVIQN